MFIMKVMYLYDFSICLRKPLAGLSVWFDYLVPQEIMMKLLIFMFM